MTDLFLNGKIIKTIIFDFDGTLARLNIDFGKMRQEVDALISGYGMDPLRLHNGFILEKMNEAALILKRQAPDLSETFLAEAYARIETLEIEAARTGELFAMTRPLLETLQKNEIRTGIITRNCARAVYTVFPDILSCCPVVVCRDDVRQVKPHPEHILAALNRLGADPETALMIGDHPLDIDTGRNAKTRAAGVLSGNYAQSDFLRAGADAVFFNASDVLMHLRS